MSNRYVNIGRKYYDLSSGDLSTDPIAKIPAENIEDVFYVYSAEALLQDLEMCDKNVPVVIWPCSKKTEELVQEIVRE